VLIASIIGFIVYLDSATLISELLKMRTNYRRIRRSLSKRGQSGSSKVEPNEGASATESQVEITCLDEISD